MKKPLQRKTGVSGEAAPVQDSALPSQLELAHIAGLLSIGGGNSEDCAQRALELWNVCGSVLRGTTAAQDLERLRSDAARIDAIPYPLKLEWLLKVLLPKRKTDDALAVLREYFKCMCEATDERGKIDFAEKQLKLLRQDGLKTSINLIGFRTGFFEWYGPQRAELRKQRAVKAATARHAKPAQSKLKGDGKTSA